MVFSLGSTGKRTGSTYKQSTFFQVAVALGTTVKLPRVFRSVGMEWPFTFFLSIYTVSSIVCLKKIKLRITQPPSPIIYYATKYTLEHPTKMTVVKFVPFLKADLLFILGFLRSAVHRRLDCWKFRRAERTEDIASQL